MSQNFITIEIAGQQLNLLPEKAIFRPSDKSLILSDVHLGKSAHFRKAGVPLPQQADYENLNRLETLIDKFEVKKVIVNGDLFHSFYNSFASFFLEWRIKIPIPMLLITGNHDLMPDSFYKDANIELSKNPFVDEPFIFSHEPDSIEDQLDYYAFYGHIHPGIRLHGPGRQSLKLPVFYFTEKYALLPAFGSFTGLAFIKPVKNSRVFVCLKNEVSEVKS
ncbi:MAG: ligase-associated DNA damage response endonuclease PdeM [Chitinophagaceae bacterium]|nr:MAG: ligase-associated DNA damage response endonuclease PdeM [Chitinophagaceae bacterium]